MAVIQSISEELIPLHSVEAEMSALGSMLYGERAADEVFAILDDEDLYRPAHREIFRAMRQLQRESKAIDLVTLKQELVRRGQLEDVGGEEYLIRVAEFVPSPANASHYAKIVLENATLRSLEHAGHEIVKVVRDHDLSTDEKVDAAEREVYEVGGKRLGKDFAPMRDLARDVLLDIDSIVESGEETLGLTSGFGDLDALTTGFYGGDLVIVAARPSMGKTSFKLSMALAAARAEPEKAVAVFSLEMSSKQIARRLVSMKAKVSSGVMKKPNLHKSTLVRLTDACEELYSLPLYIDETSDVSGFEILGKCRRLKRERGLSLVVVDYLQLMRANRKSENRVQEVSDIARSLKALAKELDVPVIAGSQLSRNVENRENKVPQLSDIRESGSIEAEADMVMFIYREEYYKQRESREENPEYRNDPDHAEQADIIIAKHRNGPTGVVKLAFQPAYALFSPSAEYRD
jgi:replicative DNA helicase